MTGRWKKEGNLSPPSNELAQEPEGNEENRHSDPDSNKMKINYAKESKEAHKNNLAQKQAGVAILISNKVNFKPTLIK
jgi:hypothetical protein